MVMVRLQLKYFIENIGRKKNEKPVRDVFPGQNIFCYGRNEFEVHQFFLPVIDEMLLISIQICCGRWFKRYIRITHCKNSHIYTQQ